MKTVFLKAITIIAVLIAETIFFSGTHAQNMDTVWTVSGTVTDQLGNPLPGASIVVKGTTTGTITNMTGKYSINAPENAVLQFSFVGYAIQEKLIVENRQVINVVMEEEEGIETAKPIDLTVHQIEKVETDNSFGFRMFREVSKQKGENTFFSPLSLNMALGMLYNGSSGTTRTEMAKTLGITNCSLTEINEYYQKMMQELLKIDPITEINIANSFWYRNELPVKASFIETGKKYFDAEVKALDFNSSTAADIINKWCAEKTKNRINHIIDNSMTDDMMMTLINALYFKSKWQKEKKFEKEKTKLDVFTKTNRQKIKVQMMEQTNSLPYYADEQFQCVELPYGNQAFSMIAMLPHENMDINRLIDHLADVKWQDVMNNMREQRVWLKLPRFKMECDFSLSQPIMNLGMKQIFDPRDADFENIAKIYDVNWYVSDIKQKTFVEVNEEGTEAAAVTAIVVVGFGRRGTTVEPVRFFADRPFLFLIREKSTGLILFIGRIDEPCE